MWHHNKLNGCNWLTGNKPPVNTCKHINQAPKQLLSRFTSFVTTIAFKQILFGAFSLAQSESTFNGLAHIMQSDIYTVQTYLCLCSGFVNLFGGKLVNHLNVITIWIALMASFMPMSLKRSVFIRTQQTYSTDTKSEILHEFDRYFLRVLAVKCMPPKRCWHGIFLSTQWLPMG